MVMAMTSVIYFIQRQSDDAVKIGITKNLKTRMTVLGGKHGVLDLLGIIEGGAVREKLLHWCFTGTRLDGEWFRANDELLTLIDEYATIPPGTWRTNPQMSTDLVRPNNEFTIQQTRDIVGWSYPTAFVFARKHGRKINGKWYVPFDDVAGIVQSELVKAQRMQNRLVQLGNGNGR